MQLHEDKVCQPFYQSDYTLPDQESACYFLCNMHQMCLTKQALSVGIGRAQVITRTSSNEKIKRAPFVNLNKDRINSMSVLRSRLQMCTEILFNNRKQTRGWKNDFVTYMVFRNVLNIFHISDFSIMVDHRNGNRLFINFRGHIFCHFEAKIPQNKVSWNIKIYVNKPHNQYKNMRVISVYYSTSGEEYGQFYLWLYHQIRKALWLDIAG